MDCTGDATAKSMGNCVATGHAAGIACSMAVKQRIQPRDVKVPDLQPGCGPTG